VNSLLYKKNRNCQKNKQYNQYILNVLNTSRTGEERDVFRVSHNEVALANKTRYRKDY
jgi:hypothetical protein